MNIQVKIKNLPEIQAAFKQSPVLMTKNLRVALQRAAITIGRQSRINTPVMTGRLRASTYERFYSNLSAEVGTNTNYALFVHEGTRFMRARPFLARAVDSEQSKVDEEFRRAVEKTLDEIAGRAG